MTRPAVQFNVDGSVEASGQLIANSGYDGLNSLNLLSAGSALGVGRQATITFTVRIRPNRFFGPFTNQVPRDRQVGNIQRIHYPVEE